MSALPVYEKSRPKTIQKMFATIAERYDLGNALLSGGMFHLWNRSLVKAFTDRLPSSPILLDLCAGTGDIALAMARKYPTISEAILLDFCPEMLALAEKKVEKAASCATHFRFFTADAQLLPFAENTSDAVTVAYGVRNIADRLRCFREVRRVLRPGGQFAILELTTPNNRALRFGHSIYLRYLLPQLGRLVTANREAYQYLCDSIHSFVEPENIVRELQTAQFSQVEINPLFGGIATLFTAR